MWWHKSVVPAFRRQNHPDLLSSRPAWSAQLVSLVSGAWAGWCLPVASEAGGSGIEGHSELHRPFEASLDYTRPYLKKNNSFSFQPGQATQAYNSSYLESGVRKLKVEDLLEQIGKILSEDESNKRAG